MRRVAAASSTLLFAGLVSYTSDGSVKNEVAESIETSDNQNFTVKIKDGWTFSDGTPVTADSFIKAWNYGALLSNAQLSSYFYELIEGYSAEKDSELTGLAKVDDLTFTIKLTAPASDFAKRLGTPPTTRCPSPPTPTWRPSARPRLATAPTP